MKKLSDSEYGKYNKYLQDWYNYCFRLELGIPAKKPALPTRFNKVLSVENLERLHDMDVKLQKEAEKTFSRYIKNCA